MPAESTTQHTFYFSSKGLITARSLADNLIGLDGIAHSAARLIEGIVDVRIKDTEVLLESYKDYFVFRLLFGSGEAAERKLEKFRTSLKLKNMSAENMARLALFAVISYGAWKLYNAQPHSGNDAAVHFENSFNNMAVEIGMDRDQVIALIEKSIPNPEPLKKDVLKIARPDGQHLSGDIVIDADPNFTVPRQVVDTLPEKYELSDAEVPEKDFMNIQLVVRALDLDNPERGWWAVVPDVFDKRLPVSVDGDLDPAIIPVGKYFRADIRVLYKIKRNGEKSPKRVLLLNKRVDS